MNTFSQQLKRTFVTLSALCLTLGIASANVPTSIEQTPLMSTSIKQLPSGEFLMSFKGTKEVKLFDKEFNSVIKNWSFEQTPTGVASSDSHYYVTTFTTKGELHKIDPTSGEVVATIDLKSGAMAPTISADQKFLYVSNQFQNTISKVDLNSFTVVDEVAVLREPKSSVITKDGNFLYVNNFLPAQRADVDVVCSAVSIIDLKTFKVVDNVRLANGSNALRGIALSPDGRFVMVSHNLGRFQVPTNQLQQGWMNTSAVSIIEIESREFLGAILVDEPELGAAGIDHIDSNDSQIVIAHSGTHEISVIDYEPFLKKFEAAPDKSALNYDLKFLYGLRQRIKIEGNGPRQVVIDNERAYVPTYFSDTLSIVNLKTKKLERSVAMQPQRVESEVFRGEKYFNDAKYCFQSWQSCNGCHPGDGRTDGMNWDLMNDGVGNAKNCKSMLYSHVTPPSMITGIRAMAEIAVRKGFFHIQFSEISEEYACCVDEYLKSLRPVESPYKINGEFSELAKRGKTVFQEQGCAECHSGQYFTDMNMYVIGEDVEFEKGWDTPTLIEVWRTAPYLFDGRAATMREVYEVHKHGITRKISKKDLDALTEYVNSL
ncbi:MAG: YVTN family beta-propeller repeat-containing protein [Rikenellaceae bacterium]